MDTMVYRIIYSARKTMSISVTADGEIVVRAPRGIRNDRIRQFLEEKREWIRKQQTRAIQIRNEMETIGSFSEEDIRKIRENAQKRIPLMTGKRAAEIGVKYGKITIRCQKTRWGSCSSKRNLSFNCLLLLCPDWVADYVIVHELCHLKEMNHSTRFWTSVEKYCPGYRNAKDWLKTYGYKILLRIR